MLLYYHDDDYTLDSREDHNSGETVSYEQLAEVGVIYHHFETEEQVDALAVEKDYKNKDQVCMSLESLPGGESALKEKLNEFFKEHLHEDEEIRYILDGSGFFDVRSKQDRWIRAKLNKGDLIILPAGIYHRFTLTTDNYVKALRLFKEQPKWVALERPCDDNKMRKEYIKSIASQ